MAAIGFTGAQRYAVTTQPLQTRRQQQSWYRADTVAAGK
jgi:cytochrome c oxidase subunit 2